MRINADFSIEPHDRVRADDVYKRLCDVIATPIKNKDAHSLVKKPDSRTLIRALAGNSPFLARLMLRHSSFLLSILQEEPEQLFQMEISRLEVAVQTAASNAVLMQQLRLAKARMALLVAAADLSGAWSLTEVTYALSAFADKVLIHTLSYLLHNRMQKGDLARPAGVAEGPDPGLAETCGLFILAMGKLGAYELNYSSDIDLIVFYDRELVPYQGKKTVSDCMIRLTQDLVRVLEERTGDGYVFRVDLRLRPDPGATPLAIPVSAAEAYYQSLALNWERAAMIKARVCAGDIEAGTGFLQRLHPFIWRRSLDYTAIEDIHAIKDQIHRHHHHYGTFQAAGYDVKLGPGGIREIEFYAQINQLIAGGRAPALRIADSLGALAVLAAEKRITRQVHDDLRAAYLFLRMVEHRLQMVNDEQTHRLPETDDALLHIARFCGFPDRTSFEGQLSSHVLLVTRHYDALLPHDRDQVAGLAGPDMRSGLEALGYKDPESMLTIIERWQRGRYRTFRVPRARRLLDQSLITILRAFSKTADPDKALGLFDSFLAQLPAGVQLFSLFQANPVLFDLIARIMGIAPQLANVLAKRPHLIDLLLDPDFFEPLPDRIDLKADLERILERARDYQDVLDLVRIWADEKKFQIGVQALEALSNVHEASLAFTTLADVTLDVLKPYVEQDYATRYGRFSDGALALVAMGKFGGCELSFGSDLDVIMLYDAGHNARLSSGPRQVGPSQYYSGLGQALVTAITALTPEGRLWDMDTRLRPSGQSGPLAVTLETFSIYYRDAAWAWEHMALTRARLVATPDNLADKVCNTITKTLTVRRDKDALLPAVRDMRQRLAIQFKTDNPWSLKHVRGGLIDLEFIVQYLLLAHGASHPHIFTPRLDNCIRNLKNIGALDEDDARCLMSAHALYHGIQGLLRLTLGDEPDEDQFVPDLCQALVRTCGRPDFATLKADLKRTQSDVHSLLGRVIPDSSL